MAQRMLIDAAHAEETRVVVVDGNRLQEFDFESTNKVLLKGNIYLAKVARVEPSLQAAFIDYGGDRHGFLAFNEIHPDYYQIPVSDRQALLEQQAAEESDAAGSGRTAPEAAAPSEGNDNGEADTVETVSGQEEEEIARRPRSLPRYRIQEVIKRRQILLVQVTREERGNKGAALTTYISLAGRYCVLMPNTTRGGGISRKIQSSEARKRLRATIDALKLPAGMAVILRTAGQNRTKAEIKRDYDYLLRLWEQIRQSTLAATAPAPIHEEANLIKRSIRDLYNSEISEVLVEGDQGYRTAKDFMKRLMPSHAKRVQPYRDTLPVFTRYRVESQLDSMHSSTVQLPSGGYIVISPTEALVAIDVNSGRATRERNIEETATKTNLEAASEIARQLRLRDLAGLVVVDFIDMAERRNARSVERRLKDAVQSDRARIQMGRISSFGLLEFSRQRLRPSLQEISSIDCPHCAGSGQIRSLESAALHALRSIEEEGVRGRGNRIRATVPTAVALYLMNRKRTVLGEIEARYGFAVTVETDDSDTPPDCRIEVLEGRTSETRAKEAVDPATAPDAATDGRRGRRRANGEDRSAKAAAASSEENDAEADGTGDIDEAANEDRPRRRRRGRRGGRRVARARTGEADAVAAQSAPSEAEDKTESEDPPSAAEDDAPSADAVAADGAAVAANGEDSIVRPKRRRRARKAKTASEPAVESTAPADSEPVVESTTPAESAAEEEGDRGSDAADGAAEAAERPKRRRRPKKDGEAGDVKAADDETASAAAAPGDDVEKPKRRRRRKKSDVERTADADAAAADGEAKAAKAAAASAEGPVRRRRSRKKADAETAGPESAPVVDAGSVGESKPADRPAETAADAAPGPAAVTEPGGAAEEAASTAEQKEPRRGWWQRMADAP